MTDAATARALHRLSRPLRHRAGAGWLGLGVGAAALLLGLGAWAVRAGLDRRTGVGAARVGGVIAAATGRGLARLGRAPGAHSARRCPPAGGAGRVAPRGAHRAARSACAGDQRLAAGAGGRRSGERGGAPGAAAVEPIARPVRLLAGVGLAVLVLGLGAFASAGPVRGAAAALWHPVRAWHAMVAPVRIAAEREVVDRGDSVGFRVEALGRRTATLWLRAPGEAWHPVGVRLDSLGHAVVSSGPLTSDLYARVTSGSRGSDTVLVRVRLPVFLGALTVTAHYPRYLGSRGRAGADRRRHAAPAGGNPARDQGRGDRAARGRRLGRRPPPRGAGRGGRRIRG